jgi:hypothetical protein
METNGHIEKKDEIGEAKYLYCIIDCACLPKAFGVGERSEHSFGPIGIGDRGDYVYTIPYQDISAVVSDIPPKAIECNPENALTHENIIEQVMLEYTVLPMRFGTIFLSEERVIEMLKQCYRLYKENLQRLQNKFEISLKVLWDEQNIKREIETTNEEAKKLKAEIVRIALEYKNRDCRLEIDGCHKSRGQQSSIINQKGKEYFLKRQLTKWIEQLERIKNSAMFGTKRKYASFIYEQLSAVSFGAVQNPLSHEKLILNAAFLIDKKEIENFKGQVEKIAASLNAKGIEFFTTGPWPCYNFVLLNKSASCLQRYL